MPPEQKTGPKDVLLHILSIIFLYVAVASFINLVLMYLDVKMPDPLQDTFYIYDSIRWILAVLVIVFPAYLWSVWFLDRSYKSLPERRELRSRKWLVYITLCLAALLMIGDLIALVYELLRGEFTTRFLLKVLTVLLAAGAVFIYYLWDVRRSSDETKKWPVKLASYGSIAIVIIALVLGFILVGSPSEERAYRFDDQRVSDLSQIQNDIINNYWITKRKLPEMLSQIPNGINVVSIPVDPETSAEYEYRVTAPLSFELCATFSKPSRQNISTAVKPAPLGPYSDENWQHGAGRICFERNIDPARFPSKP